MGGGRADATVGAAGAKTGEIVTRDADPPTVEKRLKSRPPGRENVIERRRDSGPPIRRATTSPANPHSEDNGAGGVVERCQQANTIEVVDGLEPYAPRSP